MKKWSVEIALGFGALFGLLGSAQAAGLKEITVPADANGPAISALVATPCAAPATAVSIMGFTVPGVRDCPVEGKRLPLVVVSHGLFGFVLSHHDTVEALADAGFVVVALNHPLDSGIDTSRADENAAFAERPRDVSRLLDFVLRSGVPVDPARIGFFGFSRGGYTGLVLAGAAPNFGLVQCPEVMRSMCTEIHAFVVQPGRDPRIKAFVIADPLAIFPRAGLDNVSAPMQLWASALGGQGVVPETVAELARNLPARPEFHSVPNSAHLSFLRPCSPEVARDAGDACTDPPGFDRTTFHKDFNRDVLLFFRKTLTP